MTATAAPRRLAKPDDALAGSARYLIQRGRYRRGEPWGCEVRVPAGAAGGERKYADWEKLGVTRADKQPFTHPAASAKLWVPVPGGPAFLIGQNFDAVKSYNPSVNYALAVCHLGDRVLGGAPFVQAFPGSERPPTLAEVQEIQKRLTVAGLRHRRLRRPHRHADHDGGARFPAQGRHGAGRRLCRGQVAGAAAAGVVSAQSWSASISLTPSSSLRSTKSICATIAARASSGARRRTAS